MHKTGREVVDSRLMPRSICGVLAAMGMAAMAHRIYTLAIGRASLDYWFLLPMAGAFYGIYLFGHVALKGRLPSFMGRVDDCASRRTRRGRSAPGDAVKPPR